jgi:hypothetical protein
VVVGFGKQEFLTSIIASRRFAAEYDIILRSVARNKAKGEKLFFLEVEYENKTNSPVKYRHDQRVVFDTEGHTFEPVKDFTHPHLYSEI